MKIAEADLKGKGKNLRLCVTAVAPTLGWTNVELTMVQNVNPPVDGIQDFILSNTPPNGVAATAIELFPFEIPIDSTDWFQGVRICNIHNETLLTLRNPVKNTAAIGKDQVWVTSCGIAKDKLVMEVSYAGGLHRNHTLQLAWDGQIRESFPVQVTLALSHNCNKDFGKAIVSETLQFDLSCLEELPMQEMRIYLQSPGNETVLNYCPVNCKPNTVVLENKFRKATSPTLT